MCLSMENCVGIVIKVYIENSETGRCVCFCKSVILLQDPLMNEKEGCVFRSHMYCRSVLEQIPAFGHTRGEVAK